MLDQHQDIANTSMRRWRNYFNTSAVIREPQHSAWQVELALLERSPEYMLLAETVGRPHDNVDGMPTSFEDNSSVGNISLGDSDGVSTTGIYVNKSVNNSGNSSLDVSNQQLLAEHYVLIVMYTMTTLLAILGNSIAIVIFTKGKRSKTELRPFLINLAVADLIMAIFCIPFTFTYQLLESDWIFSAPMCPLVMFLQTVSVTGSVSTNMAIGIDRFSAIAFPLFKTRNTSFRYKLIIGLIWIIAIALSAVQLFVGATQLNPQNDHIECIEMWPDTKMALVYTIMLLILTYVVPVIILTVTYSIVGYLLCKRHLPGNADLHRDQAQLRSKLKIVKMLVTIVVLFALCWLPIHTFFLVLNFTDKADHQALSLPYFLCHWVAMSNSFVNPIVYSLLNDSFRADLKALFISVLPVGMASAGTTRRGAVKIRRGVRSYTVQQPTSTGEFTSMSHRASSPTFRNCSDMYNDASDRTLVSRLYTPKASSLLPSDRIT